MMEDSVINLPEGENLTAWRLGRVEKAIEELDRKLDSINTIKETVIIHSEKLQSLERSRDRLIAAFSGLSAGVLILILQMLFNIFGGTP